MGIKRYRPEEIVTKLRQVEVLVGQPPTQDVSFKDSQIVCWSIHLFSDNQPTLVLFALLPAKWPKCCILYE
jgi:hypothetical protein